MTRSADDDSAGEFPQGDPADGAPAPAAAGAPSASNDGPRVLERHGAERYEVVRRLGEGAMGTVFMARDRSLKREVALKTIRSTSDEHQARFLEETQILGQLEHPNIVPLHDVGVGKGERPYCTMRYVRGQTLGEVIKDLDSGDAAVVAMYSLTRLVQIFLQVAQAIDFAHFKGVLHRDLKPSNVMLGEHGEVQVLDWGLAKKRVGGSVITDIDSEITQAGRVVGTPSYMSPEQARGFSVDTRSDVYALGAILYQLLTLRRPFDGRSPMDIMAAVVRDLPQAPRLRRPDRVIPEALERACMTALNKDPAARQQSARELHDEVQRWLETESDRARRQERAEQRATEGAGVLQSYRDQVAHISQLETMAGELRKRFSGWQSIDDKAELFALEDRIEQAYRNRAELASTTVATLTAALEQDGANARARGLLAEYYWERFREAEAGGDLRERDFFATLVATYDDGRYERERRGDGSLTLASAPSGAEVWLFDLAERQLCLKPANGRKLGLTPLPPQALAMGSYLVVLRKEGFRDVRYPVHIRRNTEWTARIQLYTEAELGTGWLLVPGGPFRIGGDDGTQGFCLKADQAVIDDFAMATHPVTMAEYLGFIRDLAGTDPEQAERRSPRRAPDGGSYLVPDGEGRPTLPSSDEQGDVWDPRWPVFGVSWDDAVAYCVWRSGETGQEVYLPSEEQWEKAARGVDGRFFPWGNRFDPSLCNMRESRRLRPAPVPVEDYPSDESVYAVRGLAGNTRDWTSTIEAVGEGESARDMAIVRGGAWNLEQVISRSANRFWLEPTRVFDYVGFRMARSLPRD